MLKLLKYIILLVLVQSTLFSQFGKNIVQYDQFNWHYIQTDHFDIYYYNPGKQQAEFVAHYAEEAYQKIKNLIGWGLNKRSDIIIYNSHNDFQQTNVIPFYMEEGIGGVTELMKNRMVIPYDGSLKEFKHVIYHELVHVFINDGFYGGSFMNMLKNNNVSIPLWMNEGLAEYLADDWNTNSDMWLRDLAINYESMPAIPYLNGYLAYRGGQSVWKFITSKWGEEIIAEIFSNIKYKRDLNKGLEKSLGISIKELSSQWHQHLKRRYWPDIENREDIKDIARQLTNHVELHNSYNIAPSISPSGEQIAMYSNKDGEMAIYLISSQDGKFLSKIAMGQVSSEFEELHILKPGITWSPDGDQLAFAVKSGNSDALVIIDVKNPKNRKLKKFDVEGIFRPSWNPINNKIAFIGYNNFSSDVFIYDIDNNELIQLTNDTFSDIQVSWAPDGKTLLVVSDRGPNIVSKSNLDIISIVGNKFDNYDIYKLDLNNNLERLTETPFNESFPQYSPDGNKIAFISDESGINNIYITEDNFQSYQNLTDVLTGITQLDWYTDSQIIFTGFYLSGYDIFSISDIDNKLRNTNDIPIANWKKDPHYNLLRKSKEYTPNTDLNYLRKYQFTEDYNLVFSEKNESEKIIYTDSTGMHVPHKYKTKYTLDYAGAQFFYDIIADKAQGMGTFLFSDILGNHKIGFQTSLVIDFKQSDILFYYSNLENRVNWETSFYNFSYPGQIYIDMIVQEEFYNLIRDVGFNFNFYNPFSKFSRIEGGIKHHYLEEKEERKNIITNYEYSIFKESFNISSYYLKYVWDNTRQLSGNRTYIEYLVAPNINNNDFIFDKISVDSRNYIRLSYKSKVMLASRIFIGASRGRDARIFAIGGSGHNNTFFHSDNALINPEYRANIMTGTEYKYLSMNNFQYPVRGYNVAQKYGKNSLILNMELRLPLLIYYFPTIKHIGQIFGVLFVDAGVAWNDIYPSFSNKDNWDISKSSGWIMSCGIGPRFNLFGIPWKLDYAWQYNPYDGIKSSKNWYLSIGFDF